MANKLRKGSPYLKKVRLKNFKCWQEVSIDIKPLTILIGPNGSGKSSVLQALSILKRFATIPNTLSLDNLGDLTYADYLNLGTYEELVHRHDTSSDIFFQIRLENDFPSPIIYEVKMSRRSCSTGIILEELGTVLKVDFSLPYSLNVTSTGETIVKEDGREY
ncbi:MAG: AAA family ATPase, partial [Candidatus Brockarchaeota archaeon]|nr:AAA family ATPase [Candidatus Brockarchaeota archaeon]